MLALLLRYARADPRSYVDRERRRARILDASVRVVRTLREILPRENAVTTAAAQGSSETLLAELEESASFRSEFASVFGAREYGTSDGSAMFADSPDTEPGPPRSDYDRLVRPSLVHALVEGAQWGPEDILFRGVHQMTECWLAIILERVRMAGECAVSDWAHTSTAWSEAASALETAESLIGLLEEMVAADYHRLRVMLRDGSGAQSPQASVLPRAARNSATELFRAVDEAHGLVALLHTPTIDESAYRAVSEAGTFAHAYQRFLFHHYQLAVGILGTDGTGSLGYGLRALAQRAAAPLFPELDRARARVATVSDVQYDHISGVVFTHTTEEERQPADGPACPEPLMRETVSRMFRALSKRDPEAWCKGFATDLGAYRSSPGTRPYIGRGALGVYIDKVFRFCAVLGPRFTFHSPGKNQAEVFWTCDITTVDGIALVIEGKSEICFTSDGRIAAATSLWNHEKVAAELLRTAQLKISTPKN